MYWLTLPRIRNKYIARITRPHRESMTANPKSSQFNLIYNVSGENPCIIILTFLDEKVYNIFYTYTVFLLG